MIKLIVGAKGSGKTKAMIDMINDSVKTSKGNVVVVEKGMKLTYDIAPAARLIDLDEYKVSGGEMLYGFVAGLMASNYDITDLYIDGILKVLNHDINRLGALPSPVIPSASSSPSAQTRPSCPTTSRSTCDFLNGNHPSGQETGKFEIFSVFCLFWC